MQFEWTISFGNMLTILSFLGTLIAGVVLMHWKAVKRLDAIDHKIVLLWAWFKREHNINEAELNHEIRNGK